MESLARLGERGMASAIEYVRDSHSYPPVQEVAERALSVLEGDSEYVSRSSPERFPDEFFAYTEIGREIEPCTPHSESARLDETVADGLRYSLQVEVGGEAREMSQRPDVGLKLPCGGWLVGSDRGEWGGELVFLDEKLEQRVVLEENVIAIVEMQPDFIVVTADRFSRGLVYEVSEGRDGTWRGEPWITLPGRPLAAVVQDDGALLVHGTNGSVLVHEDGELEMAPSTRS